MPVLIEKKKKLLSHIFDNLSKTNAETTKCSLYQAIIISKLLGFCSSKQNSCFLVLNTSS